MCKINFVSLSNPKMASFRYHNEIPARELSLLGYDTTISPFPAVDADVYIFSKHHNFGEYWAVKGLKTEGKKTVFHVCDNYFGYEERPHYLRMIQEADIVVTPTPAMAEVIRIETGKEATVIPDSYELPMAEPEFKGLSSRLRVLWFGHQFNLRSLDDILPLPEFCELRICSLFDGKFPTKLKPYEYIPWSHNALMSELKLCDCVIVPFNLSDNYNTTKSANRLVEAVRRGRFVIASPIPSYQEFKDMYIGDIHEGLEWLKDQAVSDIQRTEVVRKIAYTQTQIEQFNPQRIGKLWEEVLCG